MIKWIKEQWQWIVGGLLAIIAIAASKKRDSKEKIKINDIKLENEKNKKIGVRKEKTYKDYIDEREEAEKEFDKTISTIAKNKEARLKELENNPKELDKILKKKYGLKGE